MDERLPLTEKSLKGLRQNGSKDTFWIHTIPYAQIILSVSYYHVHTGFPSISVSFVSFDWGW